MKIYFVAGESSTYAERLQWTVDAWTEKPLAEARAGQLKDLVRQLGWPEPPGSRLSTRDFINLIDRLRVVEDGDPNAAWNLGDLYIAYTVEEIELHSVRTETGEDGGFCLEE